MSVRLSPDSCRPRWCWGQLLVQSAGVGGPHPPDAPATGEGLGWVAGPLWNREARGPAGRAWAVGELVVSAKGDGFPPKAQEGGGHEVPGERLVGHGPGSRRGGFRARPSPILPAQVGSSLRAPSRSPAELWGQLPAGGWPRGAGEAPFPERVTSKACSGLSGGPACVWNERPWRVEPRPHRLLPALRQQPAPSVSARTTALGVCLLFTVSPGGCETRWEHVRGGGGWPGSRLRGVLAVTAPREQAGGL